MSRAATPTELGYFRSGNQFSKLALFIDSPASVLSARVGTVPTTNDEITAVAITNVVGNPVDVQDGMTVLVGTSAGASDVGIVRARSAQAETLTIGAVSDIAWQTGQYLTVLQDWLIWSKKLAFTGGVWNIEGDTTYTDQNSAHDPIPVLGPLVAVKRKTGATVTHPMDASNSWVPGSAISSYLWGASGPAAVTISDLTAANPTMTFSAAGTYRVICTITAANGKTAVGHRIVFVYEDNSIETRFKLDQIGGAMDQGGWSFRVTMYAGADTSAVRDRALVAIYTRDWWGGVEASVGPVPGYENVLCLGWIVGESIDWNPGPGGSVSFDVAGPAYWMAQAGSWPVSLVDSDSTPEDWMHVQGLTIDKGIWYLVHWRSTVDRIIDVYPTGDARRAFDTSGNLGNLWEQLKSFAEAKIGARPACDRYGRLWVQVDANLMPVADRSGIPVVQSITKADWREQINIVRRLPTTSMLETAGFAYVSSAWTPLLSRAPGNAMMRLGNFKSRYNLVFSSQEQANALTALIFAQDNNPYPSVPVSLACQQRLIDIAPRQYVTLTIEAADTPRGLIWTDKKLIPRRVTYTYDPKSGSIVTDIDAETETLPGTAVAVSPPQSPLDNIPDQPPDDWGNTDPIGGGGIDDTIPDVIGRPPDGETGCYSDAAPFSGWYEIFPARSACTWDPDLLVGDQDNTILIPYPCYMRAGTATNKTQVRVLLTVEYRDGDGIWRQQNPYDMSLVRLSAVDSSGNDLIVGSNFAYSGYPNQMVATFNPAGGLNVAGFKVKLIGPVVNTRVFVDPSPDARWYSDQGMNLTVDPGEMALTGHTDVDRGWLGSFTVDLGFTPIPGTKFGVRLKGGISYGIFGWSEDGVNWSYHDQFGDGSDEWFSRETGYVGNLQRYVSFGVYEGNFDVAFAYLTGYGYESSPRLTRLNVYRAWVSNVCAGSG